MKYHIMAGCVSIIGLLMLGLGYPLTGAALWILGLLVSFLLPSPE